MTENTSPNTSQQSELVFKVSLGSRNTELKGDLKLLPTGIVWQSDSTDKKVTLKKSHLKGLDFVFSTKGYELIGKNEDSSLSFCGLKKEDYDKLNEYTMREYGIEINKKPICVSGYNWGKTTIENGDMFSFKSLDGKQFFSISLGDVKSATKQQRMNELALEFHEDENAKKDDDCLMEIRFVLPKTIEEGDMQLDELHSTILEKADIASESGEAIASFQQLPFVAPRGRYNVEMFRKFMRLHGGTFVFKILYNSISKMFLLPQPGNLYMYFVIGLHTPVRLRRKPYHQLVFQFEKNETIDRSHALKLNLSEEEIRKYPGIGLKMYGSVYEVVAKVFKALTGKKIIGAGGFRSFENYSGVKCSYKANEGYLFLLEKSIIFVHKPTLYFRHDEIRTFKFQRAHRTGGARTFDLAIILKIGKKLVFSNIQKNEHDKMMNFLSKKGLDIEGGQSQQDQVSALDLGDVEDDEGDEDFSMEEEGDDDDEELDEKDLVEEKNPVKFEENEQPLERKRKHADTTSGEEPDAKRQK